MHPSRVLLIGSRARCIFVLADNDGNVWLASLLSQSAIRGLRILFHMAIAWRFGATRNL